MFVPAPQIYDVAELYRSPMLVVLGDLSRPIGNRLVRIAETRLPTSTCEPVKQTFSEHRLCCHGKLSTYYSIRI